MFNIGPFCVYNGGANLYRTTGPTNIREKRSINNGGMAMLTKKDIETIINECRVAGKNGLGNGCRAFIPEISVDFLSPPTDFLGVGSNPAIFVNRSTFNLLGRHHKTWAVNKTVAVKESFLENPPMNIIGIIAHEIGHAFNVAAGIDNSEANAYIFEIEILALSFKTNTPLLFNCSATDLQSYFESRRPHYNMAIKGCDYLAALVKKIEQHTLLEPLDSKVTQTDALKVVVTQRFVIQTPTLRETNQTMFFKSKQLDSNTTSLRRENYLHV